MKHEFLYLCHIYKQRGRESVLTGVDLRLYKGEIVFLLGREGSGKTTLAELLCGRIQPDQGGLYRRGRRLALHGQHAANRSGIYLIGERSGLFDNLSLGENICIRNPAGFSLGGYVAKVEAAAAILCEELGVSISPHALPRESELSLIDRIFVETARAVYQRARLIIYDNLLWMLSAEECARLFSLFEQLKGRGIAILACAAELGRAHAVADRIVFLRNGAIAADYDRDSFREEGVRALLGEEPVLRGALPVSPDSGELGERRVFRFQYSDGQTFQTELSPGENVGLYCPSIRRYRKLLDRLSDETWLNEENNAMGWNRGHDDICAISLHSLHNDCFLALSVAENITLPALREILPPLHLTLRRSSSFLREEVCSLLSIDRARWEEPAYCCTRSERSELVLYRALARSKHLIVLAGLLDEPNAARRLTLARFLRHAAARKKSVVLLSREEALLHELCGRVITI